MIKEGYIKVSLLDVIRTYDLAKNNDEDSKVLDKLINLFVNAEDIEIELFANCIEAKCILKYNKGAELKSYITFESLGLALNKLYIGKNNKELLKRIEKYYRNFLDNITKNEDNDELKKEIIADSEAFAVIKQNLSYTSYEQEITGKKAKRKVLVNNSQEQAIALRGKAILD